jgi:electron transport complex protein RnfB
MRFEGCQGCGACLLTCPTHAIRPTERGLHALENLCTLCLECIEVCPVDAISVGACEATRGGSPPKAVPGPADLESTERAFKIGHPERRRLSATLVEAVE